MIKLSLVCFVLLFRAFVIADNVPVLVWGPFKYDIPAIALKSFDGYEFYDILFEHMTPDTFTLVASEEQLSTEDLSQCKTANGDTCFQSIQRIKNKLFLTSVEDPLHVIGDKAGLYKIDITIASNGSLSEPLIAEGGKFAFINFEESVSNETRSLMLTRHDRLFKKLFNQLSLQYPNLMVVYTGKGSKHQKRFARQVQQSSPSSKSITNSTAAPNLFKSDQVWLYYTKVQAFGERSIHFQNMNVTKLDTRKLLVTLSAIADTAANKTLFWEYDATTDYAILSFNIIGKDGYWWVDNWVWGNIPLYVDKQIYAKDKFSYHCSLPIKFALQNRSVNLKFYNLQLQSQFTTQRTFNKFYDAYDCIGFVSPVILMGMLVTFMLLFILFIGISCIMDIKTMDRFDDPKGKTITVTNEYDL